MLAKLNRVPLLFRHTCIAHDGDEVGVTGNLSPCDPILAVRDEGLYDQLAALDSSQTASKTSFCPSWRLPRKNDRQASPQTPGGQRKRGPVVCITGVPRALCQEAGTLPLLLLARHAQRLKRHVKMVASTAVIAKRPRPLTPGTAVAWRIVTLP